MTYLLFFLGAFFSFLLGAQYGYQYGLNQVEQTIKALLAISKAKENEDASTKKNL